MKLGMLCAAALAMAVTQAALAQDEARLHKFFGLMDSDDNDRISRPEFQSGKGAVFLAIDADGKISQHSFDYERVH